MSMWKLKRPIWNSLGNLHIDAVLAQLSSCPQIQWLRIARAVIQHFRENAGSSNDLLKIQNFNQKITANAEEDC